MDLDRPERYGEVDSLDALADVEAAAEQWREARGFRVPAVDLAAVEQIVVLGMGGSGISGDVAAALAADALRIPVQVHKTYGLPAFAGPMTLVVAVSHSGDTEETLSGFTEALGRGAQVLAITSGGAIGRLCDERGAPMVTVPGGGQPRHSLGYLAVPLLTALGLNEGVDEAIAMLDAVAAECGRRIGSADNPAKLLAGQLAEGGMSVLYGARGLGGLAAYRLKCQLNENAEMPALHGELPEINHNEIVAWHAATAPGRDGGIVWVRDPDGENERVRARFSITQRLVDGHFSWVSEIRARGATPLARLASLFEFADLTSVYTAIALDRDPTPIAPITRLKRELSR